MTDRRRSLLNAAVEQIAANGARGLRIEQVARAAGVSTALIYHHFRDRTTLLISALEHIGDRATAYTTPANGTGRDMLLQVLVDEIQDDLTIRTNSASWGELRDTAIFDVCDSVAFDADGSSLSFLAPLWPLRPPFACGCSSRPPNPTLTRSFIFPPSRQAPSITRIRRSTNSRRRNWSRAVSS